MTKALAPVRKKAAPVASPALVEVPPEAASRSHSLDLGRRVKALRSEAGLTLRELGRRSGLSVSALSKIENSQLSPTYDSLVSLAAGLQVDIGVLFTQRQHEPALGVRSISRQADRVRYQTANYDYELLCTDLARKKMTPLLAHIKAKDTRQFGPLIAHAGEEVLYVLSGRVMLHTDCYQPTLLEVGDCAYFDSRMPHACTVHGVEDAMVFWVCTSQEATTLLEQRTLL